MRRSTGRGGGSAKWQTLCAIILIAIAIAILAAVANNLNQRGVQTSTARCYGCTTTSVSQSQRAFVVEFTDPLVAPSGTQGLVLGYSGIRLHEVLPDGESGFVNATGSGEVDLLNFTAPTGRSGRAAIARVVGTALIPSSARVDGVSFVINSGRITISNATINTDLPYRVQNVSIAGAYSDAAGALIDLNPAALQFYAPRNLEFGLYLSPHAVPLNASSIRANESLGSVSQLNPSLSGELNRTNSAISVTGSGLSENGNATALFINVRNNGASPVQLMYVQLRGEMTNSTASASALSRNATISGISSFAEHFHNALDFAVQPNGTMIPPFEFPSLITPGYALQPGSSANLSFSGVISIGFARNMATRGPQIMNRTGIVSPLPNRTYDIVVIGQGGNLARSSIEIR